MMSALSRGECEAAATVIQALQHFCIAGKKTPRSIRSGDRLIPANSWWSELEFYYWKRADVIVGKPW